MIADSRPRANTAAKIDVSPAVRDNTERAHAGMSQHAHNSTCTCDPTVGRVRITDKAGIARSAARLRPRRHATDNSTVPDHEDLVINSPWMTTASTSTADTRATTAHVSAAMTSRSDLRDCTPSGDWRGFYVNTDWIARDATRKGGN